MRVSPVALPLTPTLSRRRERESGSRLLGQTDPAPWNE
jgi:hypothetical protein